MKANLLIQDRYDLDEDTFAELVVWELPEPIAGSAHQFKYRLALVHESVCVMRYDNEAGKGDHRHLHEVETRYKFSGIEQLQVDFWDDVERWSRR